MPAETLKELACGGGDGGGGSSSSSSGGGGGDGGGSSSSSSGGGGGGGGSSSSSSACCSYRIDLATFSNARMLNLCSTQMVKRIFLRCKFSLENKA